MMRLLLMTPYLAPIFVIEACVCVCVFVHWGSVTSHSVIFFWFGQCSRGCGGAVWVMFGVVSTQLQAGVEVQVVYLWLL